MHLSRNNSRSFLRAHRDLVIDQGPRPAGRFRYAPTLNRMRLLRRPCPSPGPCPCGRAVTSRRGRRVAPRAEVARVVPRGARLRRRGRGAPRCRRVWPLSKRPCSAARHRPATEAVLGLRGELRHESPLGPAIALPGRVQSEVLPGAPRRARSAAHARVVYSGNRAARYSCRVMRPAAYSASSCRSVSVGTCPSISAEVTAL